IMMLKLLIRKLQRHCFMLLPSRGPDPKIFECDEDTEATAVVPTDVKEGHFAVIAAKGGKQKRFVVELHNLTNPEFMRLLEHAKEEYGFHQKGVLSIPCPPEDLQKVLEDKRKKYVGAKG
ncbi:Auxin_inducible domain-containing protein, partial [Cephalotus follicularis]